MRVRTARTLPKSAFAIAAFVCCCQPLPGQGLVIRTNELPWAIRDAPYDVELVTSVGGRCPIPDTALTISEGRLPKGLELFATSIQGAPQQVGHFLFTLRAANACVTTYRKFDLVVTAKPILLVSPTRLVFEYRAGSGAVRLEDSVRVEASWPNLQYSIDFPHTPWLSVEPSLGKIPDAASAPEGDAVRLKADPTGLAPGSYHVTLKFYAQQSENTSEVDVTLKVLKPE